MKNTIKNPHTTRLFPRNKPIHSSDKGADTYVIQGIASLCDCVVLTSKNTPHIQVKGDEEDPNYIFLSTRGIEKGIEYLHDKILPNLNSSFVLVSGSEDKTIPNQVDVRFPNFKNKTKSLINNILEHPKLIHWFGENLDETRPKLSPIPIGFVFKPPGQVRKIKIPDSPLLKDRQTKALCGQKIRNDNQHNARKKVNNFCKSEWSSWTTLIENTVPKDKYFELIQSHTFVFCVHGGGLDPCPKAFHTILNGSIPIIRESALKSAYEEFPVLFVSEWESENLSFQRLKNKHKELSERYEDPHFRERVFEKLELNYWWNKISDKFKTYHESE